jgi:hypothetical protein
MLGATVVAADLAILVCCVEFQLVSSGPILLLVVCVALNCCLFCVGSGRLIGVVRGLLTKPSGTEYDL